MDVAEVVLLSPFIPGLSLSLLILLFILYELLLRVIPSNHMYHKSVWTLISTHLSLSYVFIIPQVSFNVNRLFHIFALSFPRGGEPYFRLPLSLYLGYLPGDLLDLSYRPFRSGGILYQADFLVVLRVAFFTSGVASIPSTLLYSAMTSSSVPLLTIFRLPAPSADQSSNFWVLSRRITL